ncbi:MAG: cytidylate kinase-like family protein [Bacillota bacterium]|nr:cytidylate kinase-like family protein [Bacillota bacterium]
MNTIITIAREYGSGGRIIGKKLAKALGFAFYDKELIEMAAEKIGFSTEYVRENEEKKAFSFISNFYGVSGELPASDRIFIAQSGVIKEIAEKENCVIVGRCADYVLSDHPCCLNIFIHAPIEDRARRVFEEYDEDVPNIKGYIQKMDKKRSSYYNYMTQNKWGQAENYHLSINSSLGIDLTVKMIKAAVEEFRKNK